MARRRQYKRMKGESNQNKVSISDLPDFVLIHILSFLKTKEAVQTCILSKKWIKLWRSLPNLTLSFSQFRTYRSFNEFVSQILSLRDGTTTLRTLNLYRDHSMEISLLQRIIKYAVSHNVQHLLLDCTLAIEYFPSCIFSCHTLTSLSLSACMYNLFTRRKPSFPNSLNWPALTSLSLQYFVFAPSDDGCVEPFSGFKMLNTLTIDSCIVLNAKKLCISSIKLVNLTIHMWTLRETEDYIGIYFGIELYAPILHTFTFSGRYTPKLFGSKSVLSSIKHVSIDLSCRSYDPKLREASTLLLDLLVELANIESLTFYSDTLEVLSSVPHLLMVELHSLCNLKSLRITTLKNSSIPPNEMVAFLIQNSPSAKVDFIRLSK